MTAKNSKLSMRTCKLCGSSFRPVRSNHYVCGKECRKASPKMQPCIECGKTFLSRRKNHLVCTRKCLDRRSRGIVYRDLNCSFCGEQFTPRSSMAKYCSLKCKRLSYREQQREAAQASRDREERLVTISWEYIKTGPVEYSPPALRRCRSATKIVDMVNRRLEEIYG